ncbi:MAG: hypothetical protein NTX36_14400, partial [Proteobacteria bacterium]|nr:hypothetical protein [Pseudomonadota bacterium]
MSINTSLEIIGNTSLQGRHYHMLATRRWYTFHSRIWYIISIPSTTAGFKPEDAFIIAYSSQYTDANHTVYPINEGGPDTYSNYISQTMNIFDPQKNYMRIYPVFHFMPGTLEEIAGDPARRRDGKLHLMNTVPDSINSKQLL